MPTTVNGIGTCYYGKRDSASRIGNCQHCGAQGNLQSYTTRLWFVILFIPIIPLKRVRLLDYCPHCSRHWITNPEQYEMSRQLVVSGALEKYRDAPSVEAAHVVHAQLLTFHMHSEADKFRQTVLETYPESAELRAGLASHLDQTGRWNDATGLYESAYQRKPDLPEVRNSLAWRRINENKLDEAFELLDFLRQPGAGQSFNLGQLELLAKAYQKAGNHERVLEICNHLLREFPETGNRYEFRKLISKSERAINSSTSILPERAASIRDLFDSKSGAFAPWVRWTAFCSVAFVLFVFGMAALNEYRRQHRTLHVVSGFAQPFGVSIDGGSAVRVTSRTPIDLSEGKHRISITGPFTTQHEIELQSNYWTRWTYRPVWVFNVERSAAVIEGTLYYAAIPQPASYKLLGTAELSFIPHVDYAFEEPPREIKLERNSATVTKIHVGITPVPLTSIYLSLRNAQDPNIASTFAEGHLNRDPSNSSLLEMYCKQNEDSEEQRITDFLKAGLWRKPVSVTWHREYQRQKTVIKDEGALAAEYDIHLGEDPDNPSLLYLRGRVSPTHADEMKFYTLAYAKNPQTGWPSMAIAYDAANRAEWKQAGEWSQKAANAIKADTSFRSFWHVVRLANHEFDQMETDYRQQLQSQEYLEAAFAAFYLADLLAAQQKFEDARQVVRQWVMQRAGAGAAELIATFDLMLDYVTGNVERFRPSQEASPSKNSSRFQFYLASAAGDPDSAVKFAEIDKLDDDWASTLAISLAYALAGNDQEAARWLTRTCELMQQNDSNLKRAAALLQREIPPTSEELDDVVLQLNSTPLFIATLAQRFPDKKDELNQRAQRLNISRQHPYLLVKRALESP